MNSTIASLLITSANFHSPLFTSHSRAFSSHSNLNLVNSRFYHFMPTFLLVNNINGNDRFQLSFDSLTFSHFLSSAVQINNIDTSSSTFCSNIKINNNLKNQSVQVPMISSVKCNTIKKSVFKDFYNSSSPIISCITSGYVLLVESCNFTSCSLAFDFTSASINVTNSIFENMGYDSLNLNFSASVAVLLNSPFSNFANIYVNNAKPSAFYFETSSVTIVNSSISLTEVQSSLLSEKYDQNSINSDIQKSIKDLYLLNKETSKKKNQNQYQLKKNIDNNEPSLFTDSPQFNSMIIINKCAMVKIENSVLANEKKDNHCGIEIFDSQNVILDYIYFRNFENYSLFAVNSYVLLNYVCFPKAENMSISNERSPFGIVANNVIFDPKCRFAPEPEPELTNTEKIYGIVTLAIFSVFFVVVFVSFIYCIIKNKTEENEQYGTLNNIEIDESDSREISD